MKYWHVSWNFSTPSFITESHNYIEQNVALSGKKVPNLIQIFWRCLVKRWPTISSCLDGDVNTLNLNLETECPGAVTEQPLHSQRSSLREVRSESGVLRPLSVPKAGRVSGGDRLVETRMSDRFWARFNPRPCTPVFITRTCRGAGGDATPRAFRN